MRAARILLIFAALGWAATASAQSGRAVAAPEGWRADGRAPSGVTYFSCVAPACGPGSTVSYKRLPDGPLSSTTAFRARTQAAARAFVASGAVIEARVVEIAPGRVANASALNAVQALKDRAGRPSYLASSELTNGRVRFSVVSTAALEGTARDNLKVFQPFALSAAPLEKPAPARR